MSCVLLLTLAALSAPGEKEAPMVPDLLVMKDGTPVNSGAQWGARRAELLGQLAKYEYGHTPEGTVEMAAEVVEENREALGGKAIRRQVALHLSRGGKTLRADLLLYLPKDADGPVPVFTLLNFCGNHTVSEDPAVLEPLSEVPDHFKRDRGGKQSRYPVEAIIDRGYGLATAYAGDFDPDFDDGFDNGAHALFGAPGERGKDGWGTIGAWAWGLSRMLDYLLTVPEVDGARVAVLGHSRLGKTALWAGGQDERFALVISNNSGSGGAALARNKQGERIRDGIRVFPYWYCGNYADYVDREDELPVDQHMLLALTAPRPLYVASAVEDDWADPPGELLSCVLASPAWELLGLPGLGVEPPEPGWLPPVDQPIQTGNVGYHVRTGKHDLTACDWDQYMNFADRHWRGGTENRP